MSGREDRAVSELIGYIMILGIVISTVSVIFLWYTPFVEKQEAETQLNTVYHQFTALDKKIFDVVGQGSNATGTVDIQIEGGGINIDPKGERIVIWYSLEQNYEFYVNGFQDGDHLFDIKKVGGGIWDDVRADGNWLNDAYTAESDTKAVDGTFGPSFDFNNKNIEDMVRINLTDLKSLLTEDDDVVFGRIWVFDSGSVNYQFVNQYGTYKNIVENNGVILSYPGVSNLLKKPIVFNNDPDLVLRIVQLKPSGASSSISGAHIYKFTARCADNFLRENRTQIYDIKMQVFSLGGYDDDAQAWLLHYDLNYDFEKANSLVARNENTIIPDPTKPEKKDKILSLVQSICEVSMEGYI